MENKSNRNAHQPILNFVKPKPAFYYVLMWPKEVSTFQKLIGLSNLIHQMTLMIIFTVLEEQVVVQRAVVKHFCF